jgi:hypothetical protein
MAFAAAGGQAVFLHAGSFKAGFVHVESLFAGDVAGDFEGQAIGGVQFKGFVTVQDGWPDSRRRFVRAEQICNWAVPASTVRAKRISSRVRFSKIGWRLLTSSG